MSQGIWGTIVPSTTSGNQLASLLNDFKEAVVSGFSGTSRPSELDAGGYWVDISNPTLWVYKLYTGLQDVVVFSINLNTGVASISSADSTFEIVKISADSLGPALKLIKERLASNGQTLVGDTLGEVQFYATRDSGVNVVSARIKSISTDDTTASVQGSYLAFDTSDTGSNSLSEAMRIVDKKVGIGTIAPDTKLHVVGDSKVFKESDDALSSSVYLKKKRIAGSGQVLTNDSVGKVEFIAHDADGLDAPSALISVSARENQTNSANGSKISIQNKKLGQTTYTEQIAIEENVSVKTNLIVEGDLTVNGSTTSINTSTLEIEDSNVIVNKGGNQATANANKAGLSVDVSDGTDAQLGYDSSKASKFVIGEVGSESEVITATHTQELSNKTLTSPTINSPAKLEVKLDTEANLTTYASTATNGQIVFATDTKSIYHVVDGALEVMGGGGVPDAVAFSLANNVSVATDITGLVFNPASVFSFVLEYTIARNTATTQLVSVGKLRGVYKSSTLSWSYSDDYAGDDCGVDFSITPAGQIQYISSNMSGASYVGKLQYVSLLIYAP